MYMGGEGTHAIVSTKALQSIAMGVRHKKKKQNQKAWFGQLGTVSLKL